jgi:hypothetical protein
MVNAVTNSLSNTVTVSGSEFDNQMSNNTDTDTASVTVAPYVFTQSKCTKGVAFGSTGQCLFIDWKSVIAGDDIPVYITLVNASGVPTPPSTTLPTVVSMRFGMSCQDPVKGSSEFASFPDRASLLPKCAESSATPSGVQWSLYRALVVDANQASISSPLTFNYFDVGRIKLFMQDSTGKTGASGPVVMRPYMLEMEVFKTAANGTRTDNPGASTATGEPFTIRVGVRTRDKTNGTKYFAQNFGNEISPRSVNFDPNPSDGLSFADMVAQPELQGSLDPFSLGRSSGTFKYPEVGIITVKATLAGNDYLGSGGISPATTNIGRFVPDHFNGGSPGFAGPHPALPGRRSLLRHKRHGVFGIAVCRHGDGARCGRQPAEELPRCVFQSPLHVRRRQPDPCTAQRRCVPGTGLRRQHARQRAAARQESGNGERQRRHRFR